MFKGIFNVTNKKAKFFLAKSITDKDDFIYISIPKSVYEIDSLNIGIKRIINEKVHFTEADYPITIKPNFSTLGYLKEIFRQQPIVGFIPDHSIRDLLGFHSGTIYEQ